MWLILFICLVCFDNLKDGGLLHDGLDAASHVHAGGQVDGDGAADGAAPYLFAVDRYDIDGGSILRRHLQLALHAHYGEGLACLYLSLTDAGYHVRADGDGRGVNVVVGIEFVALDACIDLAVRGEEGGLTVGVVVVVGSGRGGTLGQERLVAFGVNGNPVDDSLGRTRRGFGHTDVAQVVEVEDGGCAGAFGPGNDGHVGHAVGRGLHVLILGDVVAGLGHEGEVAGFLGRFGQAVEGKAVALDGQCAQTGRCGQYELGDGVVGHRQVVERGRSGEVHLVADFVVVGHELLQGGDARGQGEGGQGIVRAYQGGDVLARADGQRLEGVACAVEHIEFGVARQVDGGVLVVRDVGAGERGGADDEGAAQAVVRDVEVFDALQVVLGIGGVGVLDGGQGIVRGVEVRQLLHALEADRGQFVVLHVERLEALGALQVDGGQAAAGAGEHVPHVIARDGNLAALDGARDFADGIAAGVVGHGVAIAPIDGDAFVGMVDEQRDFRADSLAGCQFDDTLSLGGSRKGACHDTRSEERGNLEKVLTHFE